MKLAVLAAGLAVGVPAMAIGAAWFSRVRGWLFALMIFFTVLGSHGALNLVSRELYRGPDRGFEITLTDLICWALIVAIVFRFPGKVQWLPRNTWLLLLFFLNACLLTAVSAEPLYTAFSLWKCLRIFCLYWCTVNCLRAGVPRQAVWFGFAGAALVVTMLAAVQKYWFHIYRVNGPFDHSNTVPLYSNLLLPVLLIWALSDKEMPLRQAVVSIILCLGLMFAVVSTFSRAGMALAAAAFGGALLWDNLRYPGRRVRTASMALCLLLAAAVVRAAPSIIARFETAPKASAAARDEFNIAARKMLADNPLGVGLNNFSYVVTNQAAYREHFEAMRSEEQAGVCHHIYWLTAAETGYLGLALYLAIVIRFAWGAVAGAWRQKTVQGAVLFGVFLGLCTLQASGFLEWAFRVTPVMQLFAICAAISAAWIGKKKRHPRTSWSPVSMTLEAPAPLEALR
ncbi:MAG TPA: O-antigen ligase family protein [Verrucomicrobiae bacterium]|nr:O-antigen ligase family protein [Verrucomicrobiae bacterium]